MADIRRFPDSSRIEREAADWIARLHAQDVSAEDRARFAAWRAAHPSHARTYDGMAAAWRAFSAAGSVVRAVSFGESMNQAIRGGRLRWRWLTGGVAAAAVVAAAAFLFLMHARPGATFQTGIGEHASISLPDGTSVELNSDTQVRVDYSQAARVIRLDRGEAYFRVFHDPSRPLWVYAGGSWVRDVGTAFNVYLRPDDVRVTVSQGKVEVGAAVSAADKPQADAREAPASVLEAGQQADLADGTTTIRSLPRVEIERLLAWRDGKVSFVEQPLSEVVREMSRYTTLEIVIDDEGLRRLPIGGTFDASPEGVQTFISMLKNGLRLRVRRDAGRIHIANEASAAHPADGRNGDAGGD
jgi:transmembrane sensor